MSFTYRYHAWLNKCTTIINKKKQENKRKKLLAILAIHELQKEMEKDYHEKRFCVEPIFQKHTRGFRHSIFPVVSLNESQFRNYFCMTATQLEELLLLVAPRITKQTIIQEPISAKEQLSMTIRFLASGDSITSMAYQYPNDLITVSDIIEEICNAIWNNLQQQVLPSSLAKKDWLNIAYDFEELWNFKHCVGAIDGKHILIQCPNNSSPSSFNYKNNHNIVLLGICNAKYIFTFVDIGGYGQRSDGSIFKGSLIGQSFHNKQMNLPEPEPITSDGQPLPYILVGDEAFQLSDYLLRPYPAREHLTRDRILFNHRLSRARRTIENTFGILVSRWKILRRPIICNVTQTMKIIQAIICLHNWLRLQDVEDNQYVSPSMIDQDDPNGLIPGSWRKCIENSALRDITKCGTNTSSRQARQIREEFCQYFNNEGAIPWQFDQC
ncbi:PREDICTED: uncharacterized protein LOC108763518 [Trachymyrmex cornetzi]|uniref:uncharacterized protein LOC108763518 n=1 Tax=Trachymyrmex cornetzi TaxID=471704 RepID=UPI00084EF7BB|nr:PREDICTED: uncharacterized protein LOC108763518 [Trachymyrmex cornetzi]